MKRLTGVRIGVVLVLAFFAVRFNALASEVKAAKDVKYPSPELMRSDADNQADYWNAGFLAVNRTLLKNLHMPAKMFPTRYAWPSPVFMGVYLWDSSFIAQVWKPWDVNTAQDVAWAVLGNAAPDGRLKHFVSPYDKSDLTQPPVIAWSAWELYQWSNDKDYLARAYPVLKNYNKWLYSNRRLPNGLFFWKHSYESGIDNSPRFVTANEKPVLDVTQLAAIDLSSYLVLSNRDLAKMAEALGLKDEAAEFNKQAEELRGLINSELWDPDTGLYYDKDLSVGKLVKIKTIASLIPLFCGVPDVARAEALRKHAMDPKEFNTFFPMPSVARDDSHFEKDCWRGPVWINTAYMAIVGLNNYGFAEDSSELAYKLVDGVYHNFAVTHKLVEFYDPDQVGFKQLHRKHGNLYKQVTLGDKPQPNFVGWTGLVNTMLIEDLVGLHKKPGQRWIEPRFPDRAQGANLKITLPSEGLVIELLVLANGKTLGKVTEHGVTKDFTLERGQRMDI